MEPKIRNRRIDEDVFLKMREPVLAQWPTGKEVNLDEAVEYQKKLPEGKNMMKITQQLHRGGKTVVFPRAEASSRTASGYTENWKKRASLTSPSQRIAIRARSNSRR